MSRRAIIERRTSEVRVRIELDLDGSGIARVSTGLPFLDHLLETLIRFSEFNVTASVSEVKRVDDHHIVEDVAIAFGTAMRNALGEKTGIRRFASAIVPMDDALALVAVDISGRPHALCNASFKRGEIGGIATENIKHFIATLAASAHITIHAHVLYGYNDHHKAEALFKALGLALGDATRIVSERVPSTKGVL